MDVRFWHIADFRESPLMSANAYSGLFAAFMGAVAAQLQSV